jgi:hypothetical protein
VLHQDLPTWIGFSMFANNVLADPAAAARRE